MTSTEPGAAHVILAVDDDADILRVVRMALEVEGLEVATARSGEDALAWIDRHGLPHLAVVDIMMPGMDGLELSRRIQRASDVPVIMLTAVDDEATLLEAIEQLAEDYVVKPFNPRELAARVKRVLRRVGSFAYALAPLVKVDDHLSIDLVHRTATVGDQQVSLTPTEAKLLHILMRSAPRTVTTDHLLRRVWPLEEVFEDTLRVHMHRLRQKIEPDPSQPRYLITQRGIGYSFAVKG
ncbi:MAG: DNA-binding response regulator [Acidobacteria bacterium]|nr:MAG: DNA-binding response regulator [Acidobacteriota bacterium]